MENVAKDEGRTVLFVSHNMGAIESLCNKGVYLETGQISFSGLIQETIKSYLTISKISYNHLPLGILFKRESKKKLITFQIVEISLLDQKFEPKIITKTWDYLSIRIKYYAAKAISNGSVVLEIATLSGCKLIQYSTQPLSGVQLQIFEGESYVDCIIPCLPLSSGSYNLSVGLAIPMVEWLCWEEHIATLEVANNDVYHSNFPPYQEVTPVAVEHYWKIPEKDKEP